MKSPSLSVKANRLNVNGVTPALLRKAVLRQLSQLRHGQLVLIEDAGETIMRPGDCAGFKANVANGHHLVNRTQRDALYLEIGTRAPSERAHYPDVDLKFERDETSARILHKSGEPY